MKFEVPKKYVEKFIEKYGKDADIDKLRAAYERSLITQGEDVGVIAAQSLGEASTQLTLRTKHAAGIATLNTTSGLPRIVEIFDAKKEISTPTMNIYLKEEYEKSKQKVAEFANSIMEIKVNDVVSSYNMNLRRREVTLLFDREVMKSYGFTLRDVEKLLSNMKLEVEASENSLVIRDKTADSVKKLIRLRNKIVGLTMSGIKGINRVIINETDDKRYWIMTAGSNLKDILKIDEVDQTRTTTNDIIETYEVLGIEIARNLIIKEVSETLENVGLAVDIRHIMLIADAMCFSGEVKGINRYGITGESSSILARASFEVPLKHLINASLEHDVDEFKYVANNVISNQVAPVGTGSVKLISLDYGRKSEGKTDRKNKEE
ncbi:DNA-directed RNA polymerase subunit A'' [Candidatus Parvarchaeota archaeon]|uniref:DNA-directed RNA polymerase n=1 Tax=Candidatus Acidifodinimicrobium mancum TaxID=2898728 RepID=A0A8T3UWG6_9ARCH|nr:DNA-directed RNA polymerase subunit A'' [Candidatus Acidifodinimicrobium mancum]MBE5729108.1 DNA-directed RNA polymerase subunit A'' [Candidatus Acidifodinimicrobium mancum]MBE5729984.1 DNA-directed RNA polymerase subunit A'' [Candidatus Acidifodinimicrobium mancum]